MPTGLYTQLVGEPSLGSTGMSSVLKGYSFSRKEIVFANKCRLLTSETDNTKMHQFFCLLSQMSTNGVEKGSAALFRCFPRVDSTKITVLVK